MTERFLQAWRWISHASTVITWAQVIWWAISAGGGVAVFSWALSHYATPWAVVAGLLTAAAMVSLARKQNPARGLAKAFNDLRNEGVDLLGELILSEDDLRDWERRVDAWRDKLQMSLGMFGEATADSVVVLGTYNPCVQFSNSYNPRHNQKRVMLRERLGRLERFIHEIT